MYYINGEQRRELVEDKIDENLSEEFYLGGWCQIYSPKEILILDEFDKEKELDMLHQSWHDGLGCYKEDLL